MDLQLKNKKVFISGSTSGIGFETACVFVEEGAIVTINGRTLESVSKALRRLRDIYPGAQVEGIAADLSKAEECSKTITKLGSVDVLVNNLGIYTSQSFESTSDEDWLELFNVNVMTAVRLSRALLPNMLSKNFGRIIFVSSECAELVPSDLIAYSTTKAALHALSKGLAQTCRGHNVTVNTVLPGSTMTEGAQAFIKNLSEKEETSFEASEKKFLIENRRNSTLQRFLRPNEVAQGIVYLSSPITSATNGSILKLEGGSTGAF